MLISPQELKSKFNVKPKLIAHVGAHSGEEASDYSLVSWGKVYWFEANPKMVQALKANKFIDPNLIVSKAITDTTGEMVSFNISTSTQSSSLYTFNEHEKIYPDIKMSEVIEVETLRLDDFFKIEIPEMINLDIQGAELLALKGASKLLPQVKWIYSEISFLELYAGGASVGEVDAFLSGFNFKRIGTRRLWGEGWGDAIYANRNLVRVSISLRLLEVRSRLAWDLNQAKYRLRLKLHKILASKN